MDTDTDLADLVAEKIAFGEALLERTKNYKKLEGMPKLQRNLKQEIKFLEKILVNRSYKKEHLQCSNLSHFTAVLNVLDTTKDNVSVMKVFKSGAARNVTVDIVCENGLKWIKVVARNPKSLSQISMGDTSYGSRSVIDKARDFVAVSKQFPRLFQTPSVIFSFANGVGRNLAAAIESYGIIVEGERVEDDLFCLEEYDEEDENENISSSALSTENADEIKKVNLDISAMLAYCSSVTNGSAGLFKFDVPILTQVAKCELQRPQKPILDQFFEGKTLYCCQTAYDSFIEIMNTIGGPEEKIRGDKLLENVKVLPDNASVEDTDDFETTEAFSNIQYTPDKEIKVGGQITERSLKVFRFGDRIRAVTVSANAGFVRAAMQQGVNFVVFLHESRALTEQKELEKGSIVGNLL
ncbi:UPF0415 protein C7orf25 homolog [Coccinella septempunctata]|uniref:UPF0415 protein C7orf25 homolog n=1 Tax=Coccinella septempunctata TaxID=41139 RepID=UPI001D094A8D|nr:UPF0415 protein C7orf25 homolog [Coccinella septempunctata]